MGAVFLARGVAFFSKVNLHFGYSIPLLLWRPDSSFTTANWVLHVHLTPKHALLSAQSKPREDVWTWSQHGEHHPGTLWQSRWSPSTASKDPFISTTCPLRIVGDIKPNYQSFIIKIVETHNHILWGIYCSDMKESHFFVEDGTFKAMNRFES